jgi:hypothetical protein
MNLTKQGRCEKGFLEKPGQLDVWAPARIRRENDWNRGEVRMPLHFADKRDAVPFTVFSLSHIVFCLTAPCRGCVGRSDRDAISQMFSTFC